MSIRLSAVSLPAHFPALAASVVPVYSHAAIGQLLSKLPNSVDPIISSISVAEPA